MVKTTAVAVCMLLSAGVAMAQDDAVAGLLIDYSKATTFQEKGRILDRLRERQRKDKFYLAMAKFDAPDKGIARRNLLNCMALCRISS